MDESMWQDCSGVVVLLATIETTRRILCTTSSRFDSVLLLQLVVVEVIGPERRVPRI